MDQTRKSEGIPSDPSYNNQWYLPKISWDQVYEPFLLTAGTATVAILDTGIDSAHPDISSVVVAGASFIDLSSGMTDSNGHGTWMAGIVAAVPNTIGIAGVGFTGVTVMPVAVLGADGTGQDSNIIAGVMYAVEHGADVILMGFSNAGFSQSLQEAIDYAWSNDVVIVAATGNDASSTPTYPAGDQGVVGVSATDENDNLAAFSNYGVDTFLAAPGTNILTTGLNSSYTAINGTSASAAIVSGVAAFMRASDASLSNGVIVGRLARTADPAGTLDQTGNGRVNMARAVADTSTESVIPLGAPTGGPIVGPYVVAAAQDGTGSMTVSPTNVDALSSGNTFTFTFTPDQGGAYSQDSLLSLTIPAGWTSPSGHITVGGDCKGPGNGGPALNSITGSGPWTVLVNHECQNPKFVTVTYSSVTAPNLSAPYTFTTATRNGTSGTLKNLVSSPIISVNNPVPATTSISPASATYGGSGFTLTVNGSNFVSNSIVQFNGSDRATTFVSSTQLTAAIPASDLAAVGTFSITVFNPSPGGGTSNAQTFTVNKRNASITANNKSKIYGSANPALDATVTGTVNGDVLNYTLSTTATVVSGVGNYPITVTPGSNPNYTVTTTDGTLFITVKTATIAANNKSKVYGSANPALDATVTGTVNGDTLNYTLSTTATMTSGVGGYPITVTTGSNPNYSISTTNGALTVTRKAASVTPDAAGKIYGAAEPVLTGTLAGFLAGDGVTATYSRTAGETVAGSPYAITATLAPGGALGNYTITYNTADFTITAKAATIAANNKSKVYGSANPALDATVTGAVNGDTLNYTLSTTATVTSGVGNYPITVTPGSNPNYTVTTTDGTLVVTVKTATIAANNKSKVYGSANPALDATVTGTANGDTLNYTLSTTATTTSGVGSYPITVTPGSNPNYTVTTTGGTLFVTAKIATIAANNKSRVYGDANPALDATVTGTVNGDALNYTLSTTATVTSGIGNYPIIVTPGSNPDYTISTTDGALTVTKKTASVTPNAASKIYGDPDPALTGTLAGFLAGDGVIAAYSRTAGETVAGSPYTIAATLAPAGVLGNYTITYNTAGFTITKAVLAVTANNASRTYGSANPSFTASYVGFKNGDTIAVLGGTPSLTTTASSASPVGTYTVAAAAGTLSAANYTFSFVNGTLTVNPALLSVRANDGSKSVGQTVTFAGTEFTTTGLVNSDTVTSVTLSSAGADASAAAGTYSIVPSAAAGTGLGNYTISYVNGTLTVNNKTTPTVAAWPLASGIAYGQTLSASTLTGGSASVDGSFAFTAPGTTPNAGTYSASVTFTPTDMTNYNTVTGSVNVTVAKATPSVTAWPSASAITYGQTLASSTLTGGSASVTGTFAFTTPSTAPNAGTYSASVTFTPTDTANYNAVTGSVTVTVAKATPSVTAWPTASGITYGQTLASSTLTGGAASTSGSFAFTAPSTAPNAGTYSASVTFTPTDTANYNAVTGSVNVTVANESPTITAWPTASGITYGQTLASSTLTGGSASVTGTFAFTTPSTAPNAGTYSASVTFTPTDTTNYSLVTGSVTVDVAKATPSVTAWPTASGITYGQSLASSTLTGGSASTTGAFAFTMPGTTPNAGTYSASVTFNPADTTNYNAVSGGSVNVAVAKATPTITWSNPANIPYGTALGGTQLNATSTVPGTYLFLPPAGTVLNAGNGQTLSVSFTPTDTTNFTSAAKSVTINVLKAGLTIQADDATKTVGQTVTFSGTEFTATGLLNGDVVTSATLFSAGADASAPAGTYSIVPSAAGGTGLSNYTISYINGTLTVNNKVTPTIAWSNPASIIYGTALSGTQLNATASVPGTFAYTPPAGTVLNAGSGQTLSVLFTPDDAVHYNTASKNVTINVIKASASVTLGGLSQTYDGSGKNATATTNPAGLTVTFTYNGTSTAPVNAGSYAVVGTVSDPNYQGSASGTMSIAKADPIVTAWPTAGAITYGQTLASSMLTGGAGSTAGSFAFTTPAIAPNTGTAPQSVTFTPADPANYSTVVGSVSVTVNKATPAITAWPMAGAITYGQTLASSTLTGGSASAAGSFAFTSPAISPNTGTAPQSVTFTPADPANYTVVIGTVSVTVNKATPSVTAWPTASPITYGQQLSSSTLSGGSASVPGAFAFTTPNATPNGGVYNAPVTFTPDDTANYSTVSGSVSVTVAKAEQATLTVNAPATLTYGTTATLTATGGSGTGGVSYSTGGSTGCSVSGSTLSVTNAGGACEVTATKAADTNYNAATSSPATVVLQKANQGALTVNAPASLTYGTTSTLSSTGGNGTGTVTYSAGASTGCTVSGSTLSVIDASGTCSVTAEKAGDGNYNGPVTSSPKAVILNKANQGALTVNAPSSLAYGSTTTLSSTGGSGTGAVTYSAGASTGCSVSGGALSVTNAGGTCQVTATKAADTNYFAVTSTPDIVVLLKATPGITAWPTASGITYGQQLSASTLSGGSASVPGGFAFASPTTAPNGGSYNAPVIFTPLDTTNYGTVNGTVSVAVAKADQGTLTINAPSTLVYGTTATLTTTGGSGSGSVTYSAGASTGCSVSGSTLSVTNAGGACQVTATKATDTNYNAATSSPATVALQKANQTITFAPLPGKAVGDADFAPGATTSSGLAISYASSNTAVATISGGTIRVVGVGISTITASQAGNANYNPATNVTRTLTVSIGSQAITVSQHAPANAGYNSSFSVAAAASSGLPVVITTSGQCSGGGSGSATITMTNASGTCTVAYNQGGNTNYLAAAQVTETTTAQKGDQTIAFGAVPAKAYGDVPFVIAATATSGQPVSFNSLTNGVCALSGTTVTIGGAGTCTIQASQGGTAYYNAVTASTSFTIGKAVQTITFSQLPGMIIGDADFTPGATASSGLAVSYASSNTSVAMIVGGDIHIVGPGTSTITAFQSGDTNYLPAAPVQQTLTVGDVPSSFGGGTWGHGLSTAGTWKGDPTRDNTINFFADTLLCPEGEVCHYQWNFDDPASGSRNTTTGATVFHTYGKSGAYNVTLTVITGNASATYTVLAYVNTKPTVSDGTVIVNGYTVSFTDMSTDDPDLPADAITVHWGDGTVSKGPAGAVYSHTYARAKTYTIVHSVKDAGIDVLNSHGVTIQGQYEQYSNKEIVVSVPQKFALSGVITHDSSALKDVLVVLKKNGHTVGRTKTNGNGSYTFTVRPGVYTLKLFKKGFTFESSGELDATTGDITRNLTATP